MVLPEEIEGRGEITPQLSRDQQSASSSQQSSRAGGRSTKTLAQQKVQFLAFFLLRFTPLKITLWIWMKVFLFTQKHLIDLILFLKSKAWFILPANANVKRI